MARPKLKRYSEYQPLLLKPEEKAALAQQSEERRLPISEIIREYLHRGWEEDGIKLESMK